MPNYCNHELVQSIECVFQYFRQEYKLEEYLETNYGLDQLSMKQKFANK
jgi:hypothetical protein